LTIHPTVRLGIWTWPSNGRVDGALDDSGVPRNEVFITTKFYLRRDPVAEVSQSLRRLGVDQIDLYLVRAIHLAELLMARLEKEIPS
jgi:diketogulonate reductase-like aldo/keto reductase